MGTVTNISRGRFSVGDLIHHRLFGYRGVIVDVDVTFQLTEEWYEAVARSRPPKDQPWYHVLVHGAAHMTYVAEQNLACDLVAEPIDHPSIPQFFSLFEDGRYIRGGQVN
jgi:heat shock protein HspQ